MKQQKRIMVFGSNLFLGVNFDDSKKGFVYVASNCIMQLQNKYIIENYSMKKFSSEKALNYLIKTLKFDKNFDAAILELGFEDMLMIIKEDYSLESFKENLEQMVTILKLANIKVFLSTMCPLDFDLLIEKEQIECNISEVKGVYRSINKVIKMVSQQFNTEIFDHNKAISKNKKAYLSTDGRTLNINGYTLLKNMISRKLA